jgi:hypothetical protein
VFTAGHTVFTAHSTASDRAKPGTIANVLVTISARGNLNATSISQAGPNTSVDNDSQGDDNDDQGDENGDQGDQDDQADNGDSGGD